MNYKNGAITLFETRETLFFVMKPAKDFKYLAN